jgi:CheY-like chemotaxis protein
MPIRILIADDSPSVRKTIRQVLQYSGWEILEAENGLQAISQALELHPEIVVLDLAMPGMDGLAVARQIHTRLPELPILMYTMHWSSQLEVEAIKAGIRKVVAKADSTVLVAAVQEFVDAAPPPEATLSLPQPSTLLAPPNPTALLPAIESMPSASAESVPLEPPPVSSATTDEPKEPLP